MQNFKMTLAYDGTGYAGWQSQKNAPTVQETIEKVLHRILQEDVCLIGASRTDAGVHALGQVANFASDTQLSCEILERGCNALLPSDIRILEIEKVPFSFHAQYHAKKKLYRYTIIKAPQVLPQERFFVYHYPVRLNVLAMRRAARFLVGMHDFSSFQGSDSKRRLKTSRRRVFRLDVIQRKGRLLFEIEANGFLYTMVRTIVGTLLEVGNGRRTAESIKPLLSKRDRRLAGKTLPARGLCLVKIWTKKL